MQRLEATRRLEPMQFLIRSLNNSPSPEIFVPALKAQLEFYKKREKEINGYLFFIPEDSIEAYQGMKDAKLSHIEHGISKNDLYQNKTLVEHLLERKRDDIVNHLILEETYSIEEIFFIFFKMRDQGLAKNYFARVLLMIPSTDINQKIRDKNISWLKIFSEIIKKHGDYFMILAPLVRPNAMECIIKHHGCVEDYFLVIAFYSKSVPLISLIIQNLSYDAIYHVLDTCKPTAIKESFDKIGVDLNILLKRNRSLDETQQKTILDKFSDIFKQVNFDQKSSDYAAQKSRRARHIEEKATELSDTKESDRNYSLSLSTQP